jgi:indole-3-glycerol phosphate synthase
MKGTILETIIDSKRTRLAEAKAQVDITALVNKAKRYRLDRAPFAFSDALTSSPGPAIIAEFKRASPSKGIINGVVDPAETARSYEGSGATAISVLTEQDHFKGSLADLLAVRDSVSIPILRKDFIIDEYQILESAAAGADAILLIVSVLTSESLKNFQRLAHELGLDAVVEVHSRPELETAKDIGAEIIGVNNRNLSSFEVSLSVSRDLIAFAPPGAIMISESGISRPDQIRELHDLGFTAFLIGEALMKSGDPAATLNSLITKGSEARP